MRRTILFIACLFLVGNLLAGYSPTLPDYNDYDGQSGYDAGETGPSGGKAREKSNDLITFNGLTGTSVSYPASYSIAVTLHFLGFDKAVYAVIISRYNALSWEVETMVPMRNRSRLEYCSMNFTRSGLVAGDLVSYKIIYYNVKGEVLAISNSVTFTF